MINPNKINIGDELTHPKKGRIIVAGITPHCGGFAITFETIYNIDKKNTEWVYLHNCKNLIKQ